MSQTISNISWFKKYQPKTLDEYVFESEEQRKEISSWIDNGIIPGNVLMYGNAGTGKTALAQLIIRSIVKSNYDVQKIKDKGVATFDELHTWCQKQPVSSKQKIVYIEEIDRASSAAFNSLKDGLMENYQPHVAFIATTNFINRIEYPVQTRFNFRFSLNCSNLAGIYDRLVTILTNENIPYEVEDLKVFIENNVSIGLRNMINLLQINYHDGKIDFANMKTVKSEQEETVIGLVVEIFKVLQSLNSVNEKLMCTRLPLNSAIATPYTKILEIINYNNDINYTTIFIELYSKIDYLPLKIIVDDYLHDSEHKRFQNIHFISFLYRFMNCIIELSI